MRPPLLLALATILACTVPNPAFDLDRGDTSATSGSLTGAAASTSAGPTAATTDEPTPTTGPDPGTGPVDPDTGSTGSVTTTTDAASSGDTGDTSTGEPEGCWAQGADGWPKAGAELIAFLDTKPADPFISPDGLRLYYLALGERRPFLTTRKSRDLPFPNGQPLVVWGGDPQYAPSYPVVVLGEAEMLMSNQDDIAYSLYTPANADKYSKPLPLVGTNTAFPEQHITATADGEVLIVSRIDGPPLPPFFPINSPQFHQFTRPARSPAIPSWATPSSAPSSRP